jgi:hypothetical protein
VGRSRLDDPSQQGRLSKAAMQRRSESARPPGRYLIRVRRQEAVRVRELPEPRRRLRLSTPSRAAQGTRASRRTRDASVSPHKGRAIHARLRQDQLQSMLWSRSSPCYGRAAASPPGLGLRGSVALHGHGVALHRSTVQHAVRPRRTSTMHHVHSNAMPSRYTAWPTAPGPCLYAGRAWRRASTDVLP